MIRSTVVQAERRLEAAGVASPRVDAELLLAHVLCVSRSRLVLSDSITEEQVAGYDALIARRCRREPLQHLTGLAPFRQLELEVGPGVFVPRPETEIVTEAAIRALQSAPDRVAVDLGSGSGAVGLSLAIEVPSSTVHLVEVDPLALAWLHKNTAAHAGAITAVGSQVLVHEADAREVPLPAECAHVVVSNPPYIPDHGVPIDAEVREYDPALALYGGPGGLELVAGFLDSAAALLVDGGTLVIEHADTQGSSAPAGLPALLREHGGFTDILDRADLAGRERYTVARRSR